MPHLLDTLIAKLDELSAQYDALDQQLTDPKVIADHNLTRQVSVRRAALAGLVARYRTFCRCRADLEEARQIIVEEADPELVELASEQVATLEPQVEDQLKQITDELITADDLTIGSVILEVRAASGGAEAALWAGDLIEMYQRYAARKGFTVSTLDASPGEQGGVRNLVASVQGPGVWQSMGYEGGVHCVKRVPQTESQGRVHTSTATVAVLPEPQIVQIDIPESQVEIHVTTAQGPGGQNVNKVATAVHMIHLPTRIEVRMQESKSQHQNRQRAWQLLRARVWDHFQQAEDAERAQTRSKMIGSGQRSQRIRTYRFKENIVVDHRLNGTFNLQAILGGDLDQMVDALIAVDRAQRLAAL